jgi:D-amino-acid dehydrogenase
LNAEPKPTVIIGAGIVGVCCARYLQLAGVPVTLLDRVPIGEGCSFGNAGVLSSWSCEPMSKPGLWKSMPGWALDPLGPVSLKLGYLPRLAPWLLRFIRNATPERMAQISEAMFTLNHPTVEMFRQLLAGSGHESLVADASYVFVTRDAAGLDENAYGWRLRRERGAPIRVLDQRALRELEPDLAPDYVKGIAIGGQGRATNPARLVRVIGDLVQAGGGTWRQCEVRALRPRAGGGATVHTDDGDIDAPRLVIAAGAWSARLAAAFGLDIPLQGERGYHMEFANPGVQINNSVHDADRTFVASSMEGGVRCAGTSEFNALDAAPDWRRARLMKTLGKALFPKLNVDEGSEWMGRRPTLPDTIPVIGPVPGHPDVILAFGHGHLGLTGAPMTGRIASAIATGDRLNVDVAAYAPARFA